MINDDPSRRAGAKAGQAIQGRDGHALGTIVGYIKDIVGEQRNVRGLTFHDLVQCDRNLLLSAGRIAHLLERYYTPAKGFTPQFRRLLIEHHRVQFNLDVLLGMMTPAQVSGPLFVRQNDDRFGLRKQ